MSHRARHTLPSMARRIDPHKLDVAALAAEAGHLEGRLDAPTIERWREMQSPPADLPLPPVRWCPC